MDSQDSGVSARWVICGWLRGGSRSCFHEAAAPEPGGDEALRRYDDNGNGRISGAEARGHGMARVESGGMGRVGSGGMWRGMGWRVRGERIGWSLRPYSHFVV